MQLQVPWMQCQSWVRHKLSSPSAVLNHTTALTLAPVTCDFTRTSVLSAVLYAICAICPPWLPRLDTVPTPVSYGCGQVTSIRLLDTPLLIHLQNNGTAEWCRAHVMVQYIRLRLVTEQGRGGPGSCNNMQVASFALLRYLSCAAVHMIILGMQARN